MTVNPVSQESSFADALERSGSVVALCVGRAVVTTSRTLVDVDTDAVVVSVVETDVADALGDVVFNDAVVVGVAASVGARIIPGVKRNHLACHGEPDL